MHSPRYRGGHLVAAALVLAACADVPTQSARADGAGPRASTFASVTTDLGCCGTFEDVNNAGLLVGIRDVERSRAAAYTPAMGYRILRMLDSGYVHEPAGRAYGVSEAGHIVGHARNRDYVNRPVLWQTMDAVPIDLGALRPGGTGTALGVNAAGLVVGEAEKEPGVNRAFAWTAAGGMVEIGPVAGPSSAQAVNDSGKVVGWMRAENGQTRGFVWQQGKGRRPLPTLGGSYSYANDINSRGQVVGSAATASGAGHAVLWTPEGVPIDLGVLGHEWSWSVATGVNENGVVVGYFEDFAGNSQAFAWSPRTGMRRIDPGAFYGAAAAINRNGLVAGEHNGGTPVFWRITETNTRPSVSVTSTLATLYEGQAGVFMRDWPVRKPTDYFHYWWVDGENDPLAAEWSFGDGTTLSVPAAVTPGPVPKTYRDQGVYAVRLVVKDPSNTRDTLTVQVTVLNRAPTGVFEFPVRTLYEGQTFQLAARSVVDGPADLAAGVQASFDCGGGWSEYVAKGFTFPCPVLADDDTLEAGLRLRDKDGAVTEYQRTLYVQNAAPAARVSAVSSGTIPPGGTFTAAGTFSDAGAADGPWRYRYLWGDGTVTAGWMTAQGPVPQASHVYAAAGSYSVSLWVTDKDGRTGQAPATTVAVGP